MKLLVLLFLVGFAVALAVPVPDSELALADEAELEYLLFTLEDDGDDDGDTTIQGKKLRDHLDELLKLVVDAVEHGKQVKEDTLKHIKQIRDKLAEIKEHISDKAKGYIERIKVAGKDYWKKLWEKFGFGKRDVEVLAEVFVVAEDEEIKTELGRKLREHLDQILAKIKEAIENGKTVKEDYVERMNQIREQLRKLREDVGKTAKDLIDEIKVIGKDYWKKLLEKLGLGKRDVETHLLETEGDDDEPKTELGKKLQKHLEDILEKIKDAIDHGKTVKEDTLEKMKQIREKLKEMKEGIGKTAKDLLEKIKKEGKDYLQKILEKLGLGKRDIEVLAEEAFMAAEAEDDDIKTELGKKLREHLDGILEKIKDAIDHGKTVKEETLEKLKELRQKLKDMKQDVGEKAKELLEQIKEKGKDYLKKILEKLGLGKRDLEKHSEQFLLESQDEDDAISKLREKYNEMLEKIKDMIDNRKGNFKDIFEKLKELREKLREERVKLGEKGKELIAKIREKVREYFRNLLDKLGKDKRGFNVREMLKKLKEKVLPLVDPEAIKAKIEEVFGKGNEYAEMLINKLKDKNEKAKQWLLDYIDRFYENQEDRKRSMKEVYDRVKNYLKDLQIELKEKFSKFGEWAVGQYEKGLKKGKDKVENIKKLAKEFIHDAKVLNLDVIDQAKGFFKEYKDDLGTIYEDVVAKIKEFGKN